MLVKIGISKGRPYEDCVKFIKECFGIDVIKEKDDERCYVFKPVDFTIGNQKMTAQFCLISPKDVGNYLGEKFLDVVVGYDDTLYHLVEKNYHLKKLFKDRVVRDSRICLISHQNFDEAQLSNPDNIIVSEYEDIISFKKFSEGMADVKGEMMTSHGTTTESAVSMGLADLGITIVESGSTLRCNNLKIVKTIRQLKFNAFANADTLAGDFMIRHFRPDIQYVYIDGIDGSGKTTAIESLKQIKELNQYIFKDRGPLTELTLTKFENLPLNLPEGIHIVFDCDANRAESRITMDKAFEVRKESVDKFETKEGLSYFRFKYLELAAHYGLHVVDATQQFKMVVDDVVRMLIEEKSQQLPAMAKLKQEDFDKLLLVAKGESKIVRSWSDKYDIIQYIPSVYSHKKKRAAFIEGSEIERLQMTRNVLYLLAYHDIPHSYIYVGKYVLTRKLVKPPPKIEVVIKTRLIGTDKHRYVGLENMINRLNDKPVADKKTQMYDSPYVRFDWRNSNDHAEGDVAMSETLANCLIDVDKATKLALKTFEVLTSHFTKFGINIWDMCLFITEDGDYIFGEISQDNARYRMIDGDHPLDKDIFRFGGSSDLVLEKWKLLTTMIQQYVYKFLVSVEFLRE